MKKALFKLLPWLIILFGLLLFIRDCMASGGLIQYAGGFLIFVGIAFIDYRRTQTN